LSTGGREKRAIRRDAGRRAESIAIHQLIRPRPAHGCNTNPIAWPRQIVLRRAHPEHLKKSSRGFAAASSRITVWKAHTQAASQDSQARQRLGWMMARFMITLGARLYGLIFEQPGASCRSTVTRSVASQRRPDAVGQLAVPAALRRGNH
jgi:hypothetical protein